MKLSTLVSLCGLALLTSSCNLFDPFDSASGDAQLLSKGYACMDNGDTACATEAFSQLASTNERGIAAQAFAALDTHHMGMREFMSAFGSKNPSAGKAITAITNGMAATAETTSAARTALHDAFRKADSITEPHLRGMVRLLTSIAIMSSLLAIDAGTDANFTASNLVDNATTCNSTTCAGGGGCTYTSTGLTFSAAGTGRLPTTANALAGTPMLDWVYHALNEINLAVGATELNVASSGIGASLNEFADVALNGALYDATSGRCMRASMLALEIGVTE